MGTVVKRKQELNDKYMSNVRAYSAQLGRINPSMQRAFNSAYGLQRKAAIVGSRAKKERPVAGAPKREAA